MARSFNGTSDKIVMDSAASYNQTAAYWVSMFVNGPANVGTNETEFWSEANSGSTTPVFAMQKQTSGGSKKSSFVTRNDAGVGPGAIATTADVWDSTWHHLIYTQDGSGDYKMYVDGVGDTSGSFTAGATTTNWLTMGCLRWFGTTLDFANAKLAWVGKGAAKLTDTQAKLLAAGINPVLLGATHFWPLWGVDSPEPDLGTSTHVSGTLTGTSAVSGPGSALSLLGLSRGLAPFAPPVTSLTVNPSSGIITLTAGAPTASVKASPAVGTISLVGPVPVASHEQTALVAVVSLVAASPTIEHQPTPSSGIITAGAGSPYFNGSGSSSSGTTVIVTETVNVGGGGGFLQSAQSVITVDDEETIAASILAARRGRRIRVSTGQSKDI